MLPRELGCQPITKRASSDYGFRDAANLRHRAERSRHHAKDKQRFVVSVAAYDSLRGTIFQDIGARAGSAGMLCKQVELGSIPRCSTIMTRATCSTCTSAVDLPICWTCIFPDPLTR
jgi:hypothetical protein